MIAGALLTGGIVGFSIAAPVGPIGALTIRRTLAQGRTAGFLTGLGAATADSAYGAVAAFGLTFVGSFLVAQQGWLSLLGGLFLCYLGVTTFRAQPAPIAHTPPARSLLAAYGSTVFLTLTNPATILSFIGIYAGLGLRESRTDYTAASAFVLGVFLGSALWWLLLSFGVGTLRERLSAHGLRWINRISGAVIAIFGLMVLLRLALSA
ncbi:MAG TPA: LysE family transporter [Burkholderiales bacterium]|nr:LysE family transporter [Burkholderiales bacterium]